MHKILLIIKREFFSKVKKRSFLIATLLTPLLFPALMGGMIYLASQDQLGADTETVMVLDESGYFKFESSTRYDYVYLDSDLEAAKTAFAEREAFALVYIPELDLDQPDGFTFYSKTNPSRIVLKGFEREIESTIKDLKLETFEIDRRILEDLKSDVELKSVNIGDNGQEKETSADLTFMIGTVCGLLIYMFIFLYGSQAMHGVIEEKSSKVVEVIVSTVRPFQLMMGKVIGIALVGLTQFLIWIMLTFTLSLGLMSSYGVQMSSQQQSIEQVAEDFLDKENGEVRGDLLENPKMMKIIRVISGIPFTQIILMFLFYFIGGYLLYGALFAAVGSAVDSQAEAQQFMFPITIPLVISFIGTTSLVLNDPGSKMSFWLSVIPFTSPIAMMGRIGFGVPVWELLLSMLMLVIGFIFAIWVAGRIYRIGILMHGTKVNYKVLIKWLTMKG